MTQPKEHPGSAETRRQLRTIQKQIAKLQYICSGTVSHASRRCGKPNCSCAADTAARHGPYYVWSRREESRQVNSMLPQKIGPLFEKAVENYKKLRDLLRQWERASADMLLAQAVVNSRHGRDLADNREGRARRVKP